MIGKLTARDLRESTKDELLAQLDDLKKELSEVYFSILWNKKSLNEIIVYFLFFSLELFHLKLAPYHPKESKFPS